MACVSRSFVIWRSDFAINLYRYTEDVLEDATQSTTQVTQGTTQVRLSEEDKAILVVIKEQHNITQKENSS